MPPSPVVSYITKGGNSPPPPAHRDPAWVCTDTFAKVSVGVAVGALFSFIFNITPLLVTAMTFAVYVWAGNTLTPPVAFTALTLFSLVRVPLTPLDHQCRLSPSLTRSHAISHLLVSTF